MIKALRKLNFNSLISVNFNTIENYSFIDYKKNNFRHSIKKYCISCEQNGCNISTDNPDYQLTNISHGAHTIDFMDSVKQNRPDISNWHDESVMFIFESPSLDYDIYESISFNGYGKRPSKDWYWVHNEREILSYPERFTGGQYGDLVFSMINFFKLKNAYITNLVKCGMNNKDGDYAGIQSFSRECIENCYKNFLNKEIDILKPRVVFTFGSNVDNWTRYLTKDQNLKIINLPHPAGRRRGFKDVFYRPLFYWIVTEGLYSAKILCKQELQDLVIKYVEI